MSTRKQNKAVQNLFQQIGQLSKTNPKHQMQWLLRSLLIIGRQPHLSGAGFVLPTVAMVSLVVVLLTTAIVIRSFDRSRYASNVRVNEAVLNAATPALDRARSKIDELFHDPTLPQATPSDATIYNALNTNKYTFGDETRLKLVQDIDKSGTIEGSTATNENNETLTTAWKFPVDTDNNGKFDSYTLYGIYFRSPTRGADGKFNRARNPLEARTPPLSEGVLSGRCANVLGTEASPVGDSDWYKSGNKLTKSFFVHTANVPITDIGSLNSEQYEQYKGNKGFSALEFQQDWVRIPLTNNAVRYEDDIEVSEPTTNFRINGRVFTNSNLMVAGTNSFRKVIFYQVSDPDSCYYQEENSKIVVGGNIANGNVLLSTDEGQVEVHRFQGRGIAPAGQYNTEDGINRTNKTTTQLGGRWVGYNNKAYSERIGLMVEAALDLHVLREKRYPTIASVSAVARYPQQVKERFKQRFNDPNDTKDPWKILTEELETYFKAHTRRVPYAEVDSSSDSGTALRPYNRSNVLAYTNPIKPPDTWMAIDDPVIGSTANYTNLPLNFSFNNTMNLPATEPRKQQREGKEHFIGDRILVGNNIPFFWPKFLNAAVFDKLFDQFAEHEEQQLVKNGISDVYWNNPEGGNPSNIQRTRQSQIQFLPELGSVERDGFWETQAAKQPENNENTGGLRVVTGAGIYIDDVATTLGGTGVRDTDLATSAESFLPKPSLNTGVTEPPKFETDDFTTNNDPIIVWPDSMPMWMPMPNGSSKKGDLQMRATAVYHYKQSSALTTNPAKVDLNQVPIACVSSYYDPTNQTTARNQRGLPDVSGIYDTNSDGIINSSDKLADGSPASGIGSNDGRSNNGVTYEAPYTNDIRRIAEVNTYRDKLNRQARMIFPNGRIVNEPLRKALQKIDARDAAKPRSLADNAAIDTAICALRIMDGTLRFQTSPNVPHGAIKESAFLDARQVKSLNSYLNSDKTLDNTRIAETRTTLNDSYTLPLEQRQPLEIRVTELDLNLLKTKEIRRPQIAEIGTPPVNRNDNDPANNQEYLLPNSGIIYATRDDALPDLSDDSNNLTTGYLVSSNTELLRPNEELVSPTDFKLDSTRRPNGIRLINGSNLARKNFYRVAEKGLILATNLPTYIKGNFNLHKDPSPNNFTVREEFTDKLDESNWNDFYTRANTPDPNFACRQYQLGCADSGDQWRPATIISDAQTLLSKNFWDGFRDQGDYDLNNNQGNSAANARLKNGFWNNNFVTSADWAGSDGYPSSSSKNSYLINGVTPIQRRTNFPEYVMEICRKLPVSECGPQDWVVGYDTNGDGILEEPEKVAALPEGAQAAQLGAGTTARPALQAPDRRYARRVAFQRNSDNTLVYGGGAIPVRLGITDAGQVAPFAYNAGIQPRLANNALWFQLDPSNRNDLFSPRTPDIPGVPSLNLPAANRASGYIVCTEQNRNGSSKQYQGLPELGKCSSEPGNPMAQIQAALQGFLKLNPNDSTTDNIANPKQTGTRLEPIYISEPPDSSQLVVNVIDITGNYESCTKITLVGNKNSIFVFKKTSNSTLIFKGGSRGCGGVKVIPAPGVEQNNIFWAINGNVQWDAVPSGTKHEMKGTFITGSTGTFRLENVTFTGRLLGSNNIRINNSDINAIGSTDQPSLVPFLQIHSPTGTPGGNPFAGLLEDNWLQKADPTTANAAFITGDSPSRPEPSESGGGLPNLVRFLENWTGQIARISGSFMQFRRSFYSSAPFNPVDPKELSASLFYTLDGSGRAPYSDSSDTGFRYRGGTSEHRTSFFMPPTHAYMFDVALLSQSPDFFAQRFTLNSTSRPSEYFREVGRNDSWIQTLLCAAQGTGTSYTYAVDSSERPTSCESLTSYND